MKRFALALATLATLFAAPARADLIPFNYQWVSSPTRVYADSSTTSYVEFIDGPLHPAGGDGNLVPANMKTVSPAPDTSPVTFTSKPFTLTLTITEASAAGSVSMTFTGVMDGTLSQGTSTVGPTMTGLTTQSRNFNGHKYTVTMTTVVAPSDPGQGPSGAIGAYAKVRVEAIIQETPEPGTLVMAGLGVATWAVARFRRRRR